VAVLNKQPPSGKVLGSGRYLTLYDEDGWEYVHRPNTTGVVVLVAVTPQNNLLLVEQYRRAVHNRVIELPAGLVGDIASHEDEALRDAAMRELAEETGYAATDMVPLAEGPMAVGISDELISFFHARGLTRVGPGGGDDSEDITVHEVPLRDLRRFLARRLAEGVAVDPKIFAGLFMIGHADIP
jgi:ADP-ribose diphosphatase